MKRYVVSAMLAIVVGPFLGLAMQQAQPQQKQISKPAHGTGYKPLTPEKRAYYQAVSKATHGDRIKMMALNQVLPPTYDARVRYPLPVWDQADCGSCYLVSTVRTATCSLGLAGWGKPDNSFMIAAQYGMDSPRNFGGCNGGNGTEVIAWMIQHGWPAEIYTDSAGVVHKDYPAYEARSRSDRTTPGAKMWMKDATWGFVNNSGDPTVDEIKAALVNFGRLNIAIDAGGQFGSGTSIITRLGDGIDHEINVAGYDDTKDCGDGTKGAFLLENQWSTDWGVSGYRWCSYKAATHIVDWFWVSSVPLPPPTPPTPPGPDPVCPTGYHWDATAKQCVPDAPVPPGPVCPTGYHWDDASKQCVPDVPVPPTPGGTFSVTFPAFQVPSQSWTATGPGGGKMLMTLDAFSYPSIVVKGTITPVPTK